MIHSKTLSRNQNETLKKCSGHWKEGKKKETEDGEREAEHAENK